MRHGNAKDGRPWMRAPFPWPGGKSQAAKLVWPRLGDPSYYAEPFAGGLGVLLGRPGGIPEPRCREVVNDICGFVVNFWRAAKAAPDDLLGLAQGPLSELDAQSRLLHLQGVTDLPDLLRENYDYYELETAALWWWGVSSCMPGSAGLFDRRVDYSAGHWPGGVHRPSSAGLLHAVSERLARICILCGDWRRAVTDPALGLTSTRRLSLPAAVLDPPYGESGYYSSQTAEGVHEWCVEHEDTVRIALFGLENQHHLPGWDAVPWTRPRGGRRKELLREMIWFSPSCLPPDQPALF